MLCVPELKSVAWQCAILRQLVGTTKIQDGCRDPGKLQNVFIFTLHHSMYILFFMYQHALMYEELKEPFIIMSDYVHVTKIQNGHHFHQQ